MQTKLVETHPVRGGLRAALRAPIWLYRAHLGWLLGHHFVLLTHRGRKSGQPRQTVLEVVHYDRATRTHVVAAGWGVQSDWYRNIQKTPNVIVRAGGARIPARAEILSTDAAEQELRWYARHHPIFARGLGRLIVGETFHGTEDEIHRFARAVPLVALRPR